MWECPCGRYVSCDHGAAVRLPDAASLVALVVGILLAMFAVMERDRVRVIPSVVCPTLQRSHSLAPPVSLPSEACDLAADPW